MPRSQNRSAPQLLTVNEAAQLLSVSPRTVQAWIKADSIPYVTLPSGHARIPQQALLASLGGNYGDSFREEVNHAQGVDHDVAEKRVGALDRDRAVTAV